MHQSLAAFALEILSALATLLELISDHKSDLMEPTDSGNKLFDALLVLRQAIAGFDELAEDRPLQLAIYNVARLLLRL